MSLELDLQVACDNETPSQETLHHWAEVALAGRRTEAELSVRLVDEAESADLNQQYRGKQGPTNVLSFPAEFPAGIPLPLLGDLVICAPVVEREAREQHKALEAHWAHMIIHGTLHLLGFDHIDDQEAQEMETLETELMMQLGFQDPYQADDD
ncbi:rRNA maturation RNase YbeY [Aestuariirhabdus litorea]|uniref:Endoribonuclease YbeY n=1 Tax=Aestuariirhabdus litorea TaxID=2528527 RepID=A0A3P3VLS8_9GAMM|nr:rRNA maturation RNase YbeY [Aestuariirhabdus litorea]RRJ83580.1 rRNA maturation RNase YbeY [Aestuariirhabdus litorea]RWW96801.1 rRNA maturation RNase YbeY [Endozoicomonadaceae bacterium GTF-13]